MPFVNVGQVAAVIKSETEPSVTNVLWAKILNPSFPDVVEYYYYDGAWKTLVYDTYKVEVVDGATITVNCLLSEFVRVTWPDAADTSPILTLTNTLPSSIVNICGIKNTASDIIVELGTSSGLVFKNKDGADFTTLPSITLEGAVGTYFEISLNITEFTEISDKVVIVEYSVNCN